MLGSYVGQEEWKLEKHKGISIGVYIFLKDGKHLVIKISNNRQSWYRKKNNFTDNYKNVIITIIIIIIIIITTTTHTHNFNDSYKCDEDPDQVVR